MLKKQEKRIRRHKRVRAKIKGTAKVPRFYVYRTPKHIYVQIIDDDQGKTILSSDDLKIKKSAKASGKIEVAEKIGKEIAEKLIEKKLLKIVFDRGGYKYHGRIKAVADGARKGGLKF